MSSRFSAAIAAGLALISLAIACWPGTALAGMLAYSAAVALYLAYLGVAGCASGVLLWPAVVLHIVLTALLLRSSMVRRVASRGDFDRNTM
ncbi:MAG: hypothetical protein IT513_11600 [Burkholderiales bacterium]|nr:hypothetical protein [Burkholderiales bacterium]